MRGVDLHLGEVVVVWHRRLLLREGLALALSRRSFVDSAVAADRPELLDVLCGQHHASSCIIDLADESDQQWDALERMRDTPRLRLVGLQRSMDLATARRALEVGVRSVVGLDEGLEGVVAALLPQVWRSTAFARRQDAPAALDEQEREVLRLVSVGLTARAIAVQLELTPSQVDGAKQRAFTKLGAQHQAQAVAMALRLGLLADPEPRPR